MKFKLVEDYEFDRDEELEEEALDEEKHRGLTELKRFLIQQAFQNVDENDVLYNYCVHHFDNNHANHEQDNLCLIPKENHDKIQGLVRSIKSLLSKGIAESNQQIQDKKEKILDNLTKGYEFTITITPKQIGEDKAKHLISDVINWNFNKDSNTENIEIQNESIDLDEAFANINMNNLSNFTPDTTYIPTIQVQSIPVQPQMQFNQYSPMQMQQSFTNQNITNNNQQMQNVQEASLYDQVDFVVDDNF